MFFFFNFAFKFEFFPIVIRTFSPFFPPLLHMFFWWRLIFFSDKMSGHIYGPWSCKHVAGKLSVYCVTHAWTALMLCNGVVWARRRSGLRCTRPNAWLKRDWQARISAINNWQTRSAMKFRGLEYRWVYLKSNMGSRHVRVHRIYTPEQGLTLQWMTEEGSTQEVSRNKLNTTSPNAFVMVAFQDIDSTLDHGILKRCIGRILPRFLFQIFTVYDT